MYASCMNWGQLGTGSYEHPKTERQLWLHTVLAMMLLNCIYILYIGAQTAAHTSLALRLH